MQQRFQVLRSLLAGTAAAVAFYVVSTRLGLGAAMAQTVAWGLALVFAGALEWTLSRDEPSRPRRITVTLGPLAGALFVGLAVYLITVTLGGPADDANMYATSLGALSYAVLSLVVREWHVRTQPFAADLGIGVTLVTISHFAFLLLFLESMVTQYVGSATGILVRRAAEQGVAFDPTYTYALTTTAFGAPLLAVAAYVVGRAAHRIVAGRTAWLWFLYVTAMWFGLRLLLYFSAAGQREASEIGVDIAPVAAVLTILGYVVILTGVMRLGLWSARLRSRMADRPGSASQEDPGTR